MFWPTWTHTLTHFESHLQSLKPIDRWPTHTCYKENNKRFEGTCLDWIGLAAISIAACAVTRSLEPVHLADDLSHLSFGFLHTGCWWGMLSITQAPRHTRIFVSQLHTWVDDAYHLRKNQGIHVLLLFVVYDTQLLQNITSSCTIWTCSQPKTRVAFQWEWLTLLEEKSNTRPNQSLSFMWFGHASYLAYTW